MSQINWGSIADWVSGLGSTSAALVALYLARRNERIRLTGYCGFRMSIGGGLPKQELLFIAVTNTGTRATVIQLIGLRVGVLKKRHAVITTVKDQYSVGTPYTLADGQQAHWGIPLDDQQTWLRGMCKDFVRSASDVRSLRFQVHTTHGKTLNIRPESAVLEALRATLREPSAPENSKSSGNPP